MLLQHAKLQSEERNWSNHERKVELQRLAGELKFTHQLDRVLKTVVADSQKAQFYKRQLQLYSWIFENERDALKEAWAALEQEPVATFQQERLAIYWGMKFWEERSWCQKAKPELRSHLRTFGTPFLLSLFEE
jgi:hypothetical protein